MAYKIKAEEFDKIVKELSNQYHVYAPCLQEGRGTFSDTDIVGYGLIQSADEIVFDKKSMYSFKEAILPISQTMFYFTEDEMKEPKPAYEKAVVFLRNCDMHGLKRLDDIYRADKKPDFYYEQLRSNTKFIVIGCDSLSCAGGFDNCFCESMGANVIADYDAYVAQEGGGYILDSRFDELTEILKAQKADEIAFAPKDITNKLKVELPDDILCDIAKSKIWDEYDARCVICGRCNFVCPTCSCFTTQDIFYENSSAGERRRVWASCQIDGYTDIAGGIAFRKSKS